jgi:hypothetical protein
VTRKMYLYFPQLDSKALWSTRLDSALHCKQGKVNGKPSPTHAGSELSNELIHWADSFRLIVIALNTRRPA